MTERAIRGLIFRRLDQLGRPLSALNITKGRDGWQAALDGMVQDGTLVTKHGRYIQAGLALMLERRRRKLRPLTYTETGAKALFK